MKTHFLDVRKLLCPLPVLRVSAQIKSLAPGEILEVIATDPGVLYDIPAWCKIHGYKVNRTEQKHQDIHIEIEVPMDYTMN